VKVSLLYQSQKQIKQTHTSEMKSFEDILDYLVLIKAPVQKYLCSGVAQSMIEKELAEINVFPDIQITSIYTKVNGTNIANERLDQYYFFPRYVLPSLEMSIKLYKEECLGDSLWNVGLFPLFWNGNRDYLLVDSTNGEKGVFYYSPNDVRFENVVKKYDSLDILFQTVLRCYKEGGYNLESETNNLQYDGTKVMEISKEMNPTSEYWY